MLSEQWYIWVNLSGSWKWESLVRGGKTTETGQITFLRSSFTLYKGKVIPFQLSAVHVTARTCMSMPGDGVCVLTCTFLWQTKTTLKTRLQSEQLSSRPPSLGQAHLLQSRPLQGLLPALPASAQQAAQASWPRDTRTQWRPCFRLGAFVFAVPSAPTLFLQAVPGLCRSLFQGPLPKTLLTNNPSSHTHTPSLPSPSPLVSVNTDSHWQYTT